MMEILGVSRVVGNTTHHLDCIFRLKFVSFDPRMANVEKKMTVLVLEERYNFRGANLREPFQISRYTICSLDSA